MDEDTDYYRILEIDESADEATIKQAVKANYRRLAREHHPDKNPGDKNATARFQKIQHAFDILSNDGKRKDGIDSSNMTGNADNRSINVDERKNNGDSNRNEERKKHGVNERNNAREMNNVVKTRNAGMTNNSAPRSNAKPERTQKQNLILTLGNRGVPNLESQRP
ncbi:hypothetical protein BHE90_009839 [Fusarium euwallaceae]|uniref:J domain-containing protein n=1 Tax=Fusarium euwallaceae TaxID=1147111 RepID=A0A430LJ15_9HYPO|nr:hypothetical protein BHE90_009839 [Fusarium euwallaceae]